MNELIELGVSFVSQVVRSTEPVSVFFFFGHLLFFSTNPHGFGEKRVTRNIKKKRAKGLSSSIKKSLDEDQHQVLIEEYPSQPWSEWGPCAYVIANLEPGPSALRWLLGDDVADRAWGRVKITSQLIGYFEGKAVLPRIYFRTAGGHRAVAKLSLGRAGLKFESFRQTVATCQHVQHAP